MPPPVAALVAFAKAVSAVVQEALLNQACASIGRDFQAIVRTDVAHVERVRLLVNLAFAEGWLDGLIVALRIALPASGDLNAAREALEAATGDVRDGWFRALSEPARSPVVPEGGMADRAQLRAYLAEMTSPTGRPRRLLLMSGPPECGKTFARQLIELVTQRAQVGLAYIDTRFWDDGDDPGAGATHEKVAAAIASGLNLPALATNGHTTIDRSVEDLARDLADRLRASGRSAWIFIDHLDTSAATPSVKKLIQKLAFLAAKENYPLWLVVGGRDLKPDVFGAAAVDRVRHEQVAPVQDDELERFFVDLSIHLQGVPLDPADAQRARERVRERTAGDPLELAAALWAEATALFKPAEPA
ncbi:MAG: hypothetical protein Q8S73_44320 [Deltaproteobacteria bacterium]|nr:hypothetical protein [Myxococcales bacterium]MDP3221191.1 hypothetical protein [Deltaproteobacteria bacterium]